MAGRYVGVINWKPFPDNCFFDGQGYSIFILLAEQGMELIGELPVIWDAMTLVRRHWNACIAHVWR